MLPTSPSHLSKKFRDVMWVIRQEGDLVVQEMYSLRLYTGLVAEGHKLTKYKVRILVASKFTKQVVMKQFRSFRVLLMANCFAVSYVFFLCFFLTFDDCLGSFGYVDIELYLVGVCRESFANNFPLETKRSWF